MPIFPIVARDENRTVPETEVAAQLEKERLQSRDQRRLEVRLGVLVLEAQKLED